MSKQWVCHYIDGGGLEYKEGLFEEVSRTPKRLTLKLVKSGMFSNYPDEKLRKIPLPSGSGKPTRFCPVVKEYDDGDIVVYHNQDGTPYIYSTVNG